MRPSRSICTPRALPSSGRNSEYGKLEPTMSSVSQPIIMSQLGLVPRRPIDPVTNGSSSGTAALPSSAFATPAPSVSATSTTSAPAPRAPAPTSIATFSPSFRMSAARCRSAADGTMTGRRIADRGVDRSMRMGGRLDGVHRGGCSVSSQSARKHPFRWMYELWRPPIKIWKTRSNAEIFEKIFFIA